MKRYIAVSLAVIAGLLTVGVVCTRAYLHTHATQGLVETSKDGRFKVVMYRYPRLRDIPESIGFGQGFVQLQEVVSGKILAQKSAADLDSLRSFLWSSNKVVVFIEPYSGIASTPRFAEWSLPL